MSKQQRRLEALLGEMRKANAILEGSADDGGRKAAAIDGQKEIAARLTDADEKREKDALKAQRLDKAEADLEALTQEVSGAGITGMRERAELFGGNIEAHFVPGVGFTLNAIFPGIEEFRQEEGR